MDSISKRCVIGNKVIDKFHNINIVFTSARFTLYDTEERSGTITDIDNIDFTISYKEFLNFLKDDPLWD